MRYFLLVLFLLTACASEAPSSFTNVNPNASVDTTGTDTCGKPANVCIPDNAIDLDQNCCLTYNDLNVFLRLYGTSSTSGEPIPGDIDKDGTVGFGDLGFFLNTIWEVCEVGPDFIQIPGDFDHDKHVTKGDLFLLQYNYNRFVPKGQLGDMDRSGFVDFTDLGLFLELEMN